MSSPHPAPRPIRRRTVFGVLGGIASGKSAVARLLAGPDGVVLDADRYAREALDTAEIRAQLVLAFGEGVLGPDGMADREALATRIFADPEQRRRLEDWIHPLVRVRILDELRAARERGVLRIVLDVPLLLENDAQHGLSGLCDVLVFVEAPIAERDRRAVERRGWRPGEVARREAVQMPLEEKRKKARFVIENEGTLEELSHAVDAVLDAIHAA